MVISGGNFKTDSLKPKEVVSLLLDDQEMARECKLIDHLRNTVFKTSVVDKNSGKYPVWS